MNQHIFKTIALLATTTCIQAASVTVSTENIKHSDNMTDVADGQLALLVISTVDGSFGAVKEGSIAINSSASDTEFIDNVDDAIFVAFATSTKAFSGGIKQAVTAQNVNLDARFTEGDRFAIYWFPTITFSADLSTINLTAGTEYGISSIGTIGTDLTSVNWALPEDSANLSYNQANAGAANLTVVPEPTSTALLGLGGLSLLMRRRRA